MFGVYFRGQCRIADEPRFLAKDGYFFAANLVQQLNQI